jgi:hypothetical protein
LFIGALVTNYWRAQKNPVQRKPEACTIPHEGKVKITVDAAYSTDEGQGSTRAIMHDFRGKFVVAQTKELLFVAAGSESVCPP